MAEMAAMVAGASFASQAPTSPNRPGQQDIPKQAEFCLFVRYLPDDCKLEELVAAFSQYGKLLPSTRLFSMKRIGFVDFETEEGLKAAHRATVRVRNTIVAAERAVPKGDPLPPVAVDKRRQIDKARGRMPRRNSSSEQPTGSFREDDILMLDDTKRSPGGTFDTPIRRSPRMSYDQSPRLSFDRGDMSNRRTMSIRSDYSFEEDEKHDSHTEDELGGGDDMHSIYVGGIPESLSQSDIDLWLMATLPDHAQGKFRFVRSARPTLDRIGFIDFMSLTKAREALEILRGSKVKGHRLRLEMARSPPTKMRQPKISPMKSQVHHVRIPHVPPGTTLDQISWTYSQFGRITEISMKTLDLNSGELVGDQLDVAPPEPKLLLACLTFERADDLVMAVEASQTPVIDMLQVIQNGESNDVIVGPFPPTITLAQVARTVSKFGNLSGARLVKKTTACLIAYENEQSAQMACETTVILNNIHVTAIGHQVYH